MKQEITITGIHLDCDGGDRWDWVRLRKKPWNDSEYALDAQLASPRHHRMPDLVFLARKTDGAAISFAEADLRSYANGLIRSRSFL